MSNPTEETQKLVLAALAAGIPVTVDTTSLATMAKQDTAITALGLLATAAKQDTLLTAVATAAKQDTMTTAIGLLSTATAQTTGNASLASIDSKLPAAVGPTTPALSLSTVPAQSIAACTWQVTAGVSVLPLVPAWVLSTAYLVGEPVTNDTGKVYRCITAGTSAGSGGPTGTTSDITDGTAHWAYVGPVATAFKGGFAVVNINASNVVFYGTDPAISTTKASAPLFTNGGSITLQTSPALYYVVAGASAIVGVTAAV